MFGLHRSRSPSWLAPLIAQRDHTAVSLNNGRQARDAYLQYYGFTKRDGSESFKFFPYQDFRIFQQCFSPARARAQVLVVHGYYDHAGSFARLTTELLAQNFQVNLIDLPGCGLSSGLRGAIDDFATYEQLITTVCHQLQQSSQLPLAVVGHSMGAGLLCSCLPKLEDLAAACLITPFFRAPAHAAAVRLASMIDPFCASIGRLKLPTSHDPDFNRQQRCDPLQSQVTNLTWVRALRVWSQGTETMPQLSLPALILFAGQDRVIDWKYSKRFLARILPQAEVQVFAQARHQLHNEEPSIREQAYRLLRTHLAKHLQ